MQLLIGSDMPGQIVNNYGQRGFVILNDMVSVIKD